MERFIGDVLRIELGELVATGIGTNEVVRTGVSMIGTDEVARIEETDEAATIEETDEMTAIEEAAAWLDATT